MLKSVCDCCNEVIDGEPRLGGEDPEAVLLLDGEVCVMYENVCPSCRAKLIKAVTMFNAPSVAEPAPTAPAENPVSAVVTDSKDGVAPDDVHEDVKEESAPQIALEQASGQAYRQVDKDALPNQVTKQFPVKLREHSRD